MKNSNAYTNSLLANAAYVNLTPGQSAADLAKVDDLNKTMTPALAQYIADNFEVASAINTPDAVGQGSGFDATVWKGRAGTEFAD